MNNLITTPSLHFVDALKLAGNNVLNFRGRARRSEYWWTILAVVVANFALALLLSPLAPLFSVALISLLQLLTIPLTFRRLHDTGRSGWWWGGQFILSLVFLLMLGSDVLRLTAVEELNEDFSLSGFAMMAGKYAFMYILMLIYQVVLFVLMCLDSEPGPNRYGNSPKYVGQNDTPRGQVEA